MTPLRVLVVEDDAAAMRYLCAFLTDHGFACEAASSAQAAIASFERHCPDVVISDLVMPGMDGVDLLKELKSERHQCGRCLRRRCPIFYIVTGHGSVSVAVRAIMEGADDVLLKPIDEQKLVKMLRRVAEARQPA